MAEVKNVVVETVEWNTGNIKGRSFFYSHRACFPRGVKGPRPDKNTRLRS